MPNQDLLTDEELNALLEEAPVFDPQAVKRRVLAEITKESQGTPIAKKARHIGKGLLIAAAICILSVSCLAVADMASGGRIAAALGMAPKVEEAVPVQESVPKAPVRLTPAKSDEAAVPPPEEPQELDSQIAGILKLTPTQAAALRPGVQKVDQTAGNQDVKMTVLQTLGDDTCIFIKVRFDFPETITLKSEDTFETAFFDWGAGGYGGHLETLEETAHSRTCLARIVSDRSLIGTPLTLTCKNFGQPIPQSEELAGSGLTLTLAEGKPSSIVLNPQGDVTLETDGQSIGVGESSGIAPAQETAAVETTEEYPERGIVVTHFSDGSTRVDCDGSCGSQYVTISEGQVYIGVEYTALGFNSVLSGEWRLTWTLDYENPGLKWSGAQNLFEPAVTLSDFSISPLSWSFTFTGTMDVTDPYADAMVPMETTIALLRRDGSQQELTVDLASRSITTEEDGSYVLSCQKRFDTYYDLSDVTAVVIDGITLPLS